MSNMESIHQSSLAFLSERPLRGGTRVAIDEPALTEEGMWTANLLDSESRVIRIRLESSRLHRSNFIVLSCTDIGDGAFRCYVIPPEDLEKMAEEVEENIRRILNES
jgi:hypothetical protein